jgi:hypothetical protein
LQGVHRFEWTDHAGASYGFGFFVNDTLAGKIVGHEGGFPGINANLNIFVDRGYDVSVISNYSRAEFARRSNGSKVELRAALSELSVAAGEVPTAE